LDKDLQRVKMLASFTDFKQTFSSPHGHRVLRHLMQKSGFLRTSYVEKDSHTSAFNEGQRAFVIDIIRKLKVDVRKLESELMKEPEGETDVTF